MSKRKRKHDWTIMPMWGASSQKASTGSITVTRTHRSQLGYAEAMVEVLKAILGSIQDDSTSSNYAHAIDDTSPDKLGTAVCLAAAGVHELSSQLNGVPELDERLIVLNDLEAERPSSITREVLDLIHSITGERIARLRAEVTSAITANPLGAATILPDFRNCISKLGGSSIAPKKLDLLSKLVRRLRELPAFENRLLPQTLAASETALIQRSRRAADEALSEIVAHKAAKYLHSLRPQLESLLTSLERFALRFERQRQQLVDHFDDISRSVAQRQVDLKSSLTVSIYGPSKDEILVGCRTATSAADHVAFVSTLRDLFEEAVRATALAHHPSVNSANASFASLVADLPVDRLVEAFEQTFNRTAGRNHSVYSSIRSCGVSQTADTLWRRAAPTAFIRTVCGFRSGQNPSEHMIVHLPEATTAEDVETKQELQDAFFSISPHSRFVSTSATREISVARILQGFLLVAEAANFGLIQSYRAAEKINHWPHLIGQFTASPFGQPLQAYLWLANELLPHTTRNKSDDCNGSQQPASV